MVQKTESKHAPTKDAASSAFRRLWHILESSRYGCCHEFPIIAYHFLTNTYQSISSAKPSDLLLTTVLRLQKRLLQLSVESDKLQLRVAVTEYLYDMVHVSIQGTLTILILSHKRTRPVRLIGRVFCILSWHVLLTGTSLEYSVY